MKVVKCLNVYMTSKADCYSCVASSNPTSSISIGVVILKNNKGKTPTSLEIQNSYISGI